MSFFLSHFLVLFNLLFFTFSSGKISSQTSVQPRRAPSQANFLSSIPPTFTDLILAGNDVGLRTVEQSLEGCLVSLQERRRPFSSDHCSSHLLPSRLHCLSFTYVVIRMSTRSLRVICTRFGSKRRTSTSRSPTLPWSRGGPRLPMRESKVFLCLVPSLIASS